MARKLQVTAVWEIEEEDDRLNSIALTDLADEIAGDLRDIATDGDFIEVSNLRVDVQLMPRTQQPTQLPAPSGIETERDFMQDQRGEDGPVRDPDPEHHPFSGHTLVFPEGHPLHPLELAFKSDAPQSALENLIHGYGQDQIGRGD